MKSRAASEIRQIETVFNALAHAQRRQILLVLHFRGGQMTAGEIADRFSCAWPTTTRHLKILERAKLVRVRKQGRERVYQVDSQTLRATIRKWLDWFDDARKVSGR